MNEIKKCILDACDENMEAVNNFIHSLIPPDACEKLIKCLDLAVEEIFINIAHYAYYPKRGTVEIFCDYCQEEGLLSITFKDKGSPFNPIEKADPDICKSAEDREPGGLGIFLTKKFMDNVSYVYYEGQNILTLQKKIKNTD